MAVRFKTCALGLVCCSISFPAMVMAEDYFHTSYNSHISLNRGQSKTVGSCAASLAADAYCNAGGINYRIAYGYHFTPTWGMELSYGDFGRAVEQGVLPTAPTNATPPPALGPAGYTWRWEAGGWELAATGTLHFGDSFSLIGKLGALRASAQQELRFIDSAGTPYWGATTENSNNVSAGIGVQYDFNRDYAARIQYEYYGKIGSVSKIKSSAVSGCLVLKF